mgnify:CR=1 FL=1
MKFKKFKFKKVKSTNDTAIRLIRKNISESGMVVADSQLSGRGQYGRKWVSYKGNLFVSFFHKMNTKKISIVNITKINCFLVKRLLSRYIKKKIIYKKPNDLLIDKKKISGILQETISVSDKIFLITGIGININKNPNIKNYPTINMSELTNKTVNKVKIENNLKQLFEKNFSRIYNSKIN